MPCAAPRGQTERTIARCIQLNCPTNGDSEAGGNLFQVSLIDLPKDETNHLRLIVPVWQKDQVPIKQILNASSNTNC